MVMIWVCLTARFNKPADRYALHLLEWRVFVGY